MLKTKLKRAAELALALALTLAMTACCALEETGRTQDIAVIYTNDVHCAVDSAIGYAGLAAFRDEITADGTEALLVDCGDAVQGQAIGSLSEGQIPIDIMNSLGYCAMALGNHEFDYGIDTLKALSERAEFSLLSLNFTDAETGEPVFDAYTVAECGGAKIAFVGVTTPTTLTASRPTNFMNADGEYIYSFMQSEDGSALWSAVQQSVNAAREEGADYVIVLSHLGIDTTDSPYLSAELIAHTNGIDAVLDGHSHSVIECERVRNMDGRRVLLSSTGTGLEHIGYLLIDRDGGISTGLVSDYEPKDADTADKIAQMQAEFAQLLAQPVGTLANALTTEDPATGVRIVRTAETNLGDLCADAIREAAGTDIAFMNGGGVRAPLPAGEISYKDVMNVFPFGNRLCAIELTGAQLLDALEMSVSAAPVEYGGFMQVSGISFTFSADKPSPVTLDAEGAFAGVEGERRIGNVLVGGEPLEPDRLYSLAGTDYSLLDGGDGYSMFAGCRVLKSDIGLDFDALLAYLTESYAREQEHYTDPCGEGRIVSEP